MSLAPELQAKLYHYRAKVLRVVDGDTIKVEYIDKGFGDKHVGTPKRPPTLRFARIDAPEVRGEEREEGLKAEARVLELLGKHGPDILVRTIEEDTFGRWLAEIWLSDGTNLSDLLLEEGLAEEYKG
jgi:micrococcal nuclease